MARVYAVHAYFWVRKDYYYLLLDILQKKSTWTGRGLNLEVDSLKLNMKAARNTGEKLAEITEI